jgi:predicted nucleic acid-binding protein
VSAAFADTFFYLALLRVDNPSHAQAVAHATLRQPIVTTEFVVLELGNACARAEDHADFLALVTGMRSSPRVRILPLDSQWLNRGLALMASSPDKDWSLIDCISFVVMERKT